MGCSLQDPTSARTRLNRRIAALSLRRPRPWDVEGSALGRGQGVIAAILFLAAPAPPSECAGSWKSGGWNRAHLGGARYRLRFRPPDPCSCPARRLLPASVCEPVHMPPWFLHRPLLIALAMQGLHWRVSPQTAASPPPSRHQLRPSRGRTHDARVRIDVACDSGVIVHDQRLCSGAHQVSSFSTTVSLASLPMSEIGIGLHARQTAPPPGRPHCSGPDRCFAQSISIYFCWDQSIAILFRGDFQPWHFCSCLEQYR
jgi:hypothetical protein